jgi:AraC family transcriptional regulator, regulatory protein of adaptative response / methylated-DNA-[protein]-cysteine methyltransferase
MMSRVSTTISKIAWKAILKRDRHHDGKFVYAALTTGIYCRPSCAARHPHRRNTRLFATAAEADREGFVACRRCFPETDSLTRAETRIKAALEWIEAHAREAIRLATLSQVTGLSSSHLQQTFKRIVGLSPRAYCDARRVAHFKQYIKEGMSISEASYRAGYGSSRALYERAGKGLGMTPGAYGRGGRGGKIDYFVFRAELGATLIAGTDRGVCAVLVGDAEKRPVELLRQEFPNATLSPKQASPRDWRSAVNSCQRENRLLSELPLDFRRRIFQAMLSHAVQ